jgi:hypothetical protein
MSPASNRSFASQKGFTPMRIERAVPKLALASVAAFLLLAAPSMATTVSVYNDFVPSGGPIPGNIPSLGFEATSASEFGGVVHLDGTARKAPKVKVIMSSWGCQRGGWTTHDCSTDTGAKFSHPLTLSLYGVNGDGSPGALLARSTQTFSMPYRPSATFQKCFGANAGKWFKQGTCYNGKAFLVAFPAFSKTTVVPDDIIVSIAYNTTHYGSSPVGESASCFSVSPGCPYDSLNVGVQDGFALPSGTPPSLGSWPRPDDAYLNSTSGGQYCDGSLGFGTFRLDAGCWTGYQPQFQILATL